MECHLWCSGPSSSKNNHELPAVFASAVNFSSRLSTTLVIDLASLTRWSVPNPRRPHIVRRPQRDAGGGCCARTSVEVFALASPPVGSCHGQEGLGVRRRTG